MLRIKILTDCFDTNAILRQELRYGCFFPDAYIKCEQARTDIEVSGLFLDALDALRLGNNPAILVGNIAPRAEKKHKNGVPFCFAKADKTILIAPASSFVLPMRFGIVKEVYETDITSVCTSFLSSKKEIKRIAETQFRSFEYLPLLASWLFEEKEIPAKLLKFPTNDFNNRIWYVDCFGNVKTTVTLEEIKEFRTGRHVITNFGKLPFYMKLSDVPQGVTAVVLGSSGYDNVRFVEIMKQGGSAAHELNLSQGIRVF